MALSDNQAKKLSYAIDPYAIQNTAKYITCETLQ